MRCFTTDRKNKYDLFMECINPYGHEGEHKWQVVDISYRFGGKYPAIKDEQVTAATKELNNCLEPDEPHYSEAQVKAALWNTADMLILELFEQIEFEAPKSHWFDSYLGKPELTPVTDEEA